MSLKTMQNSGTVYYITNVLIPAGDAQSVQISSMAEAFSKILKERFMLISPFTTALSTNSKSRFAWSRIPLKLKHRDTRSLELYLKTRSTISISASDLVFTRDILIAFLYARNGTKVLYEIHQKPSRKAKYLLNILLKKENFLLIAISDSLRSYCLGEFGIKSKKILSCHDGVFIERYDEQRAKSKNFTRDFIGIKNDSPILLHTGSIYSGRGAELFGLILEKYPNLNVVHVGGSIEQLEKWRNVYKSYSNFYSHTHVNNQTLVKLQLSADILLFPMTEITPTFWCASPMKIFEYMATEKPIVSSRVGATSEVLNDTNSIGFQWDQPETLINAIGMVLQDPQEALNKARTALENVRNEYTWEKRIQSILKFSRF